MSVVVRNGSNGGQIQHHSTSHSPETAQTSLKLQGHEGPVLSARFNEGGDLIVSGGVDRKVAIWSVPEQPDSVREEQNYEFHFGTATKSAITGLRWSKLSENQVFCASADSTVSIFDVNKNAKVKTFRHKACVNEIDNSKTDVLLSCSDDGTAKIWDPRSKLAVDSIDTKYPLLTCTIDKNANRLYFSGIDPTISCYDVRKSDKPCWTEKNHTNSVTSITLSSDENYLVSRSLDNAVKYYDSRLLVKGTRAKPYVFDGSKSSPEDLLIRCKSFKRNDGKEYVVSGSNDGFVYAWDFVSRRIVARLDGHLGTVLDLEYSPERQSLLTTSVDGSLIIRTF